MDNPEWGRLWPDMRGARGWRMGTGRLYGRSWGRFPASLPAKDSPYQTSRKLGGHQCSSPEEGNVCKKPLACGIMETEVCFMRMLANLKFVARAAVPVFNPSNGPQCRQPRC